ncbi:hypothetical protein [Fusobacterium sp. MFO224]|uniref:hypothetical protein n=1 Tax=Fusobacterium sp. MFO224 TaxID=3378070 RepID=UPI00385565AC
MKKLTVLLAALSVASAAYAKEVMPVAESVEIKAAPMLKVTSVGQSLEIDNDSGAEDIGQEVHFANTVGLAYGDDWTFELMARKTWSMDTDEGIHSADSRIDLSAMRAYENFNLGARWRQEKESDSYFLLADYSYGMFSGWFEPAYVSSNGNDDADSFYLEAMPIIATYGPVSLGYYVEASDYRGDSNNDGVEKESVHQIRVMADLYSNDKLAINGELRYQFAHDVDMKDSSEEWQENNKYGVQLGAEYALTDALTIDGYYLYEFNKYDGHKASDDADDYYGEFAIGWTYSF